MEGKEQPMLEIPITLYTQDYPLGKNGSFVPSIWSMGFLKEIPHERVSVNSGFSKGRGWETGLDLTEEQAGLSVFWGAFLVQGCLWSSGVCVCLWGILPLSEELSSGL